LKILRSKQTGREVLCFRGFEDRYRYPVLIEISPPTKMCYSSRKGIISEWESSIFEVVYENNEI